MPRDLFEDEHRWFRESVRAFVDRTLLPRRAAFRASRIIERDAWLEAGRQGFLGLGIPSEYGGSGVDDFRFNAVMNEELSRAGMAFGSSFGIHVDVVAPYLVRLTTAEQRARWLPRFCSGELVTAIGMTEANAGSDLKALKSAARRDGADWILNGSKSFITNGSSADLVVVAARTGERAKGRDITLFAVEDGMPGFARGLKLEKVGQHESDTAELFFEDVRIPAENMIGELGGGFQHMMDHLAQERIASACLNLAHAGQAMTQTLDYVKERHAFGSPIGTFQYNRFLVAELVTSLDVAQAFVDRCIEAHVGRNLSGVDAAKAKWWTAEVQNRVIDACVQLHGGYGYMQEYDVAHAWMDARVSRIWAGSNEIMKEIIGRSLGLGDVR